jgi:hypothetical protein
MTPVTGAAAAPKPKKARTTFNKHAKEFLARELGERITRWKGARGADEKKVIEDEVWALARDDAACDAGGWGEDSVHNQFHNFKPSA